jgi:Arc/MetJ-type ribon-helix-helix transcriptional regulator
MKMAIKVSQRRIEYVEIPRDKYERLEAAVKEMNTPYHSASDLIHKQIDEVLEKYDKWLEEKAQYEKRQRKRD